MQTGPLKHQSPCWRCAAVLAAFLWPGSVQAFEFAFPAPASPSFDRSDAMGSFALPIGPFQNGSMQTKVVEGAVSQTAWTLQSKGFTTLQLLAPLRAQLIASGYRVLYECDTAACGGFDFRFGSDIAAEPAMHVDLGDFRYLAAQRVGADGPSSIAIVVSRSATLGFVQITEVGKSLAVTPPLVAADPQLPAQIPGAILPGPSTPMAEGLTKQGSVALDDLIFSSGAAELAAGEYASLDALADYLRANPTARVALVGHTDASGGLQGNIALSRERASSVRQRLIDSYAIPKEQITTEGVGYLAPRDSNLTEEGLTRNRRVEAMLLVSP